MKRYISSAVNLIENESNKTKRQLAENPATSLRDLAKLSEDPDRSIVCEVAKNPSTPVDILRRLAQEEEYVRIGVAQNPSIPENIADALAADPSISVRQYLSVNPSISAEALDRLYAGLRVKYNDIIATRVYQHPNISAVTKERMRDLVEGMCTYLYIDGDRGEHQPLSDDEIRNLVTLIRNDPAIIKCGDCDCEICNDASGEAYVGEYSVNFVSNILTNSEIDSVVAAVTSILTSLGHTVDDWEATTY